MLFFIFWISSYVFINFFIFYFSFIFISWRLITLQYCSGFCHTLTRISHGFTCVPHPDPPSHLSLHPIPLGLPWAPVSCIQPGLVVCFTLDNIHVSMLFSWNILPLPFPTESKILYICVSFSVLHIGLSLPSFKIPYICVSILYWSLSFWRTSLCLQFHPSH